MDIFDVLKKENARQLTILRKLEDTSAHQGSTREALLNQLRISLRALFQVEEDHLYPALLLFEHNQDLVFRGKDDAREIESILEKLLDLPPHHEQFEFLVERLHGGLEIHIRLKERELYPVVKKAIPEDLAQTLGTMATEELGNLRRQLAHS
ncbi:MAG: hemerythrin domain-containing protein [Desulfovibrionales bacterium]